MAHGNVAYEKVPYASGAYENSVPFRAGADRYASFRIPAVVLSRDGATLLAFAEGRLGSASDTGNIDIVLKRSTDGGLSWGPLSVVAQNGPDTVGNPAPVVLESGRVVLPQVRNAAVATEQRILRGEVSAADGRRVWVQHSDDDGESWSEPREITATTKMAGWRWYATTPGHAMRLRHGPCAGRIVVPANHTIAPTGADNGTEAKYNSGHSIYSDDDGESWRIGYLDENPNGYVNVNETTGAELPDGRIYFNTRNDATSPGRRADAYSADGGLTLVKPFRPQAGLVGPVVEGSVLHLGEPDEPDVLLFAGPADPEFRALMTVRASRDRGLTWRVAHTASGLPAAYSDLVRIDADTVGLLYETGDFSAYSTIAFRRIPVQELL
ncbi:sialidase family protein [Streptomyces sp. H27-D2]|uniref:sialidase family protein n=1 Tax=Streptomyces sp. H27-D2 TaxID=3046304 RepID=UPI002DB9C8C6|nr:sialidase family protein [Streptomyces sp. H27-D2]MEC4017847.1 sialidase family protein [Streptomyces sp. H27-D2]